jgi:malate dehydrogenase (oxaloacetate-decarboxylating)
MTDLGYSAEVDPGTGRRFLAVHLRGEDLLKAPLLNKGTAFTREERDSLGLHGLLPDHVSSIEEQLLRVRDQFDDKDSDLQRNIYLNGLQDRNETLFYRFVIEHLEDIVPVIYTPTVALACRHWSRIYRRARGIYITPRDRGRMTEALTSRHKAERPVIVVTDNERILGIGDQGAGGMGIPIGKLALYAAAAGIHPSRLIPISLDVGTNNEALLEDAMYLGYRHPRMTGGEYDEFVAEFVAAVKSEHPDGLLQWEDFANRTSFKNLERYRNEILSFNDDIQGTAAMAVAGMLSAGRYAGERMRDHRVVIVGAGSAGIGIQHLIAAAMLEDGATAEDVASRLFVLDSRGLVESGREDLSPEKRSVAVPASVVSGWAAGDRPIPLDDVMQNAKATVLIGVSGVPGIFDEGVVTELGRHVERPVVLPLSNPTSHTEVAPADAVRWTDGRALVATGSPFAPVAHAGRTHHIGQANNVFVFPGVGLGALSVGADVVSDGMLLAASHALAAEVGDALVGRGQLFPSVTSVREVSHAVALAVAGHAIAEGVAEPVADVGSAVDADRWYPEYLPYRPA